jgi:hypothetical protein
MTTAAAAPSEICEEVPAVMMPSVLNAGRSLPSPSPVHLGFQGADVPVVADGRPGAVGGAVVDRDGRARGGDDAELLGAQAVPDDDLGAAHPRRHRVPVPAEGHQRLRRDGAGDRQLGRVGRCRCRPQPLAGRELPPDLAPRSTALLPLMPSRRHGVDPGRRGRRPHARQR